MQRDPDCAAGARGAARDARPVRRGLGAPRELRGELRERGDADRRRRRRGYAHRERRAARGRSRGCCRELGEAVARCSRSAGSRGSSRRYAPQLGRSLCELGRYDEAEPWARARRELGAERRLRHADALAAGHRRACSPTEASTSRRSSLRARRSRSESDRRLNCQGEASATSPRCLHAGRPTDEAAAALEQALDRYERKKNLAMVAQVRAEAGGAPCPRVLAAATRTASGPSSARSAAAASRPPPPPASSARRSPSSSATSPARPRSASRPTRRRCARCSPATSSG